MTLDRAQWHSKFRGNFLVSETCKKCQSDQLPAFRNQRRKRRMYGVAPLEAIEDILRARDQVFSRIAPQSLECARPCAAPAR